METILENSLTVIQSQNNLLIRKSITKAINSVEEFKTLVNNDYSVKSVIGAKLSDIIVNDDGTLSINTNNEKFNITEHAAKILCKLLKIPFPYASGISLQLLKISIEELKNTRDKEIKFIISVPTDDLDYDGIIVNISTKNTYAESYIQTVIDFLESDELTNKGLKFYNGFISHTGYQLNYIEDHKQKVGYVAQRYDYGNSFNGDFYRISDVLELNIIAHNIHNNLDIILKENVHAPEYKLTSNKVVEMGDEYNQNLIENLKQDCGIGLNPKMFLEAVTYCENHDISFFRFKKLQTQLNKIFITATEKASGIFKNKDYCLNLLMVEKEKLETVILADLESIIEHTLKTELIKRLQTIGIDGCNALIILQNILSTKNELDFENMQLVNEIAKEVLFDTLECKVETPERIAEGVTLK